MTNQAPVSPEDEHRRRELWLLEQLITAQRSLGLMMAEPDKTHPDYWVRVRGIREDFNMLAARMIEWTK